MEDGRAARMPVIGDIAPAFTAVTTQGEMNFPKDYYGKWVVLFSYQMDFSPVCTTELMTFASIRKEFEELQVELIGLSIASVSSHIAWLRKCKELVWKDIKHVEISFPLIADVSMQVAKTYAMLHENTSKTQTVRAVFVIDPEAKIRAILYYPFSVGRSIQEIKRIVVALQKTDRENAATPADWMPGEDVILPPPKTSDEAAERMDKLSENMYCIDWFLAFRQSDFTTQKQEIEPEINPYPSAFPARRKRKRVKY